MIDSINKLLRLPGFARALQIISLGFFIILVYLGIQANTQDSAFAKVLRNTNLANLMVWSYWWPLIVFTSIFLGRVWCLVCPLGLVSSILPRFSLNFKPPRWMSSGWLATALYILILFGGVHMFAIHRVPLRMAVYLIILFAVVFIVSLLFSGNAFCAHVCPAGRLMSLYARLAPFGWGVRNQQTCLDCRDKSCVSLDHAFKFNGQSCSVGLYPAKLEDNSKCILCTQCLVSCEQNNPNEQPRSNPGWFRRPWFQDILGLKALGSAEAMFCLIVSGFVIYEILTEWQITKDWILWMPHWIAGSFGITSDALFGLVKAITLFLGLPLIIWATPFVLFRATGGKIEWSKYFQHFSIAFIPVMAAAHCSKALLKMSSRIPYWEHIPADPVGIKTTQAILDNSIQLSTNPGWIAVLLSFIMIGMMIIGLLLSAFIIYRLLKTQLIGAGWQKYVFYWIPIIYGGGFLAMLLTWRIL